jgi:pSer/pThr/pTyr-binding forkhead associated (FHA) protein
VLTRGESEAVAQVVVELNGQEVVRTALKGPSLTVGRDRTADIHLDNRALSRKHAKLEKKGAAIWVADLGSQNGTYVNGERIAEPRALKGGDIVEVGRYQLRIEGVEEAKPNTPVLTLTGPEGRHRFAMVGEEIIIGRAPSCDIAINHKSISRRHVRIAILGDGKFTCEDLGSQNGTRINGHRTSGPTPFEAGEIIQMSDFSIEVGYLDGDGGGGDRGNKTMMIDRSELAKAAYVDGDFEKMRSSAGRLALGRQDTGRAGELDDDEPATRGFDPMKAPPADNRRPTLARRIARLTVTHPDFGERAIDLDRDVVAVGEDGGDGVLEAMSFAKQGYLLFIRTESTFVVTVAGDRRLVTINGRPQLCPALTEGDTVEFGVLTAIFRTVS